MYETFNESLPGPASDLPSCEVIRRYAARLVRDLPTAEDIAQETFLRFEQHRDSVQSPKTWLYRTARNLVIDHFRRSGRFSSTTEEIPADATRFDPAQLVEKKETQQMIREQIDKLPAKHREVLRLKFQEGLKYAEIAEIMNEPITTIAWLIHDALRKLREQCGV